MDSQEKRFLESVKDDIADAAVEDGQDKAIYFVIGLSLATILVSIFVFGLIGSKKSQLKSLDVQIQEQVTAPLEELSKERQQVTSIGSQLEVLSTALSSRVNYGQIVKDLAANTYKQTNWSEIDYTDGKIVLSGGVDDFLAVSKTVTAFTNLKSVESVNLTSVNIKDSTESVEYVLEIEFDETSYKILSQSGQNGGN